VSKKNRIKTDNLGRLMIYILGHRPDEFGLVPDRDGFVTYKELLWAIHEEQGWGYVRQGHINEVMLGRDRTLFQAEDNRIRVLESRRHLDLETVSQSLPKVLFIAVRRRAHPHVMEKGLRSNEGEYLLLAPEKEMAMRIGRRRDQKPVLLKIMASSAHKEGNSFYAFGDLFLTTEIQSKYISGPPVSKETLKTPGEEREKKRERPPDFKAGTFVLDIKRGPEPYHSSRGKKRRGWKEEARGLRKGRER